MAPDGNGSSAGAPAYRPPQNTRQKVLCEIFADVLELPRVGVDDDFFTLGGRSIDGVFIVARAAAELGSPISLADLFDAPTVAELDRQLGAPAGAGPQRERTDLR